MARDPATEQMMKLADASLGRAAEAFTLAYDDVKADLLKYPFETYRLRSIKQVSGPALVSVRDTREQIFSLLTDPKVVPATGPQADLPRATSTKRQSGDWKSSHKPLCLHCGHRRSGNSEVPLEASRLEVPPPQG
jgi:hypothetical protein